MAAVRDPDWEREELILAMDLYVRRGRHQLDRTDSDVIELSHFLNRLRVHPPEVRTQKFRNPNGVSMKLGNFWSIDPEYGGSGLPHGGKLERLVWAEFAEDPEKLKAAAAAIKRRGF